MGIRYFSFHMDIYIYISVYICVYVTTICWNFAKKRTLKEKISSNYCISLSTVCLSIGLVVHLSSICFSICMHFYLSIYLSICMSIHLSVYHLSLFLSFCLSLSWSFLLNSPQLPGILDDKYRIWGCRGP